MSNLNLKTKHSSSWKTLFLLGMCLMLTTSCLREAFVVKRGIPETHANHYDEIANNSTHPREANKNQSNKISKSIFLDRNRSYSAAADELKPETVKQGSLLFIASNGSYSEAPRLHTDVDMVVSGMIARVTVKQRFENTTPVWQEGVYVFPLPENAAVDHLKMQVGHRIIEGEIKPREEAKTLYTQAKLAGKKASLVEQKRPNIFTTSVANIGPNDNITVQIEYQHDLRYTEAAGFSLRFPMVVGQRYTPDTIIEETLTQPNAQGWHTSTAEPLTISSVAPDSTHPLPINPVSLRIALNPGMPLAKLHSPYHSITKTVRQDGQFLIELSGENHANRDFVLEWQPDTGHKPKAALFAEKKEGQHYMMLMIMPPVQSFANHHRLPRESIFVIDTSGSMRGRAIEQAQAALRYALTHLQPGDQFNVIQFNDSATSLFSVAQPVNRGNIESALHYVAGFNANGGTKMAEALYLALNGGTQLDRVRQVVFLTDGSISNERQLFEIIRNRLGDSRLFTIGIGAAPNSFFMHKAAQFGRGTFTYIGHTSEVAAKMSQLFSKLESPVMTHLEVSWPAGVIAETWPRRLPDLYQGEPLVIKARVNQVAGEAIVTGRVANGLWRNRVNLESAINNKGIGVLWARAKIAALMDSVYDGASRDAVKQSVIEVALAHHLVSRYTSLVAIDRLVSRPLEQQLSHHQLPVNLPQGTVNKTQLAKQVLHLNPSHNHHWETQLDQLQKTSYSDKKRYGLAATRSIGRAQPTNQLTIPLLEGRQKIVGTGKRLLYLGWRGAANRAYTVIVKRKGYRCNTDSNCWKTTTNNNFVSLWVNLKKGLYTVTVTDGNQSATGFFTVIASAPKFFPAQTPTKRIGWALELLAQGKSKWTLEAYQQVAEITDEKARKMGAKLAEGLSLATPTKIRQSW